ncbi:Spindle pole body [Olea europaea subsp. europaea]|uniref:Spindle pole body n=1 Tax=Olea europaea subsp. europaea TaxID=158383 RepID=A0A8S0S5R8_OLEEU|nr:Spindle pole body [Olea europaea subsp. europaea]
MFDCLFKTKFYSKCKSSIKLTETRIEMIRKKRNAIEKYMRNDIADLLRNGFDMIAYQRAEKLPVELDISTCYDLVEQFCVHISSHLIVMDKQRECPEECREAVSSLMFAAARFGDLPELRELRTIFSERFGKSLEYYVNKEFVEKLKRDRPSKDMKLQLMQDIATESGLDWNSKALENELYNAQVYGKKNDEEENVCPERNDRNPDDIPSTTDNKEETTRRNEKQNEAETLTSDSGEESEDDEPFSYKNRPPPYTKSEVEKNSGDSEGNVKAKMHLKETDQEKPNMAQRILKFLDKGYWNQSDDEERRLDRLLSHNAEKKAPRETEESDTVHKISPERDSIGTSKTTRKDGSSRRTASLPVELTSPPKTPKGHARASSFQPEILNSSGHVHPKLPDYDDFIARLAALRGK